MSFNTLSKQGEIEFWLSIEDRTNTWWKNLQTALLREDLGIYQKNAIFYINNHRKAMQDDKKDFSCGLKSGRSPEQVKYLIQFKDDLVRIVK